MKLLYLYIEDYGCIKNQEFNFDSEIQFHYDSQETHNLKIVNENLLPTNFWGEGSVKSVSASVGSNGAGKTTIAKFLVELLYHIENLENNHFIVIFKNETLNCIYNSLDIKRITRITNYIPLSRKFKSYIECDFLRSELCINFIYNSNHYSPAHEWANKYVDISYDLSTTASLYRDSKTSFYERLMTTSPEVLLNRHKNNEYKRIISFIRRIYLGDNEFSRKIRKLIPINILIQEKTIDYLNNNATKIKSGMGNFYGDKKRVNECFNKLKKIIENIHSPRETFVDFRIKTYAIIALIDAFPDKTKVFQDKTDGFHELLECIQNTSDHFNCEKSINNIIDFFNRNIDKITDRKVLYFIQEINNLQKISEKYDIKLDTYKKIKIECSKNLHALLQVFKDEWGLFYSGDFFKFDFYPVLSSGEMSCLTIFSRLYEYLSLHDSLKNFVVFFDEIEITLEPNLQRQIVSLLIDFLNSFKDYSFHIIFASHSPILLSDIPDSNVVFLKKDDKTRCTITVKQQETGKTFGSNIYTLYKKSFFMDKGLMGEFAEQKIEDIIKDLLTLELKEYSGNRENKYQELEKEIEIIGEPVIRNQLKDRLKWVQMRNKWENKEEN